MASTRQYPKYVRVTETTLGYQRSIPKRYAHLTKKRLWSYPLGLSPSASDATIYASVIKAEESYQLFLKRLESTDPSAYTDTEIDRLAEEILRKRSLKPGLFNKVSDELGVTGFRIKEEKKLTPRMLQEFQQQDPSGINVIDGYKAVKEQTIVTDGYKKRIDKYIRFKEKYLK